MDQLPVSDALPDLARALRAGSNAVLIAPPGAGKTTLVPLALLDEPWLAGQRIVMLEPRRLAARAAAHRMAQLRGERVGDTVGYRVRRDTQVSSRTRIEVVTEGVLTRMLNADPTLDGIGLVILDEYHERSLHADLGLALSRHSQLVLRDDLRLLVMSATLAGEPVARLLGDAPIIRSEGRAWPVEVRHLPPRADQRLEAHVAMAVRRALAETTGDLLVFLPGQGEIVRTRDLLGEPGAGVDLHALFGNLSMEAQDAALRAAPPGRRKVILATNIAESSLTIDGVRVVVDSGWARASRFSPRSGMERLELVRISRASADQRAGRAGRQGPGTCYRLWEPAEPLRPFGSPVILEADLAPLALELAVAGVRADELPWLDPPPPGPLQQAVTLLQWLELLDAAGVPTPHGRAVAALGTHPRLGHMLLRAQAMGLAAPACDLAPLLEERDPLQDDGRVHDADLHLRLALVRRVRRREGVPEVAGEMRVRRDALYRIADESRAWRRDLRLRADEDWGDDAPVGRVLALAFPDRVAQRRGDTPRFVLRAGGGVAFRDSPALAREPWVVVAETDGKLPEAGVYLAAAITEEDIREDFGLQLVREDLVAWDTAARAVVATRRETLGALTLREHRLATPDRELVRACLRERLVATRLADIAWSDHARATRERLAFVHHHLPEWPSVDDESLLATLDDWLGPHLDGVRTAAQLAAIDLGSALLDRLAWSQRSRLDALAPTHVVVPTGSRIPVDYSDVAAPLIRVRLQEMFGESRTPAVLDGRVPLTLHLLSPAHRPLQVTRDLAGFWRTSYLDVKKEMKGRYPRHYWPDDPLVAEPTRRAKPRGT